MSVIAVRRSHVLGGLGLLAGIVALAFWAPWTVESRGGRTIQVGNMKVTCGLDEQPMVRQVGARADQIAVECVDTRMVSMPGAGSAAAQPAAAYAPAGAYTPAVYTRPAPVRTSAPVTRTASTSAPVQEPVREEGRSWKKTALIIGGSTGAGAGVGAIAGGKKGALIGAAIGGGSAAIYEAIKRK